VTTTAKVSTKDEVQEFLLGLARKHGEEDVSFLNPHDVVDAARPAESVIHDRFTWDDGLAADHYRLWEARQLIRVHVKIESAPGGKDYETRVFVSLSSDRKNGGGYRIQAEVLSDAERRKELLADALRELRTFEAKYASLRELSKVISPIRKYIQKQDESQTSPPA
jgi:hypothetical protein